MTTTSSEIVPEQPNALIPIAVRFCEKDPIAGAHALEALGEEQALEVLESLSRAGIQKLLPMMDPTFITAAASGSLSGRVTPILERGGAAVCSSVLLSLPESKWAGFLASLPEELQLQMQELLTFPEASAGKIMKTDYSAFHQDLTVAEAVARLKARAKTQRAPSNIFVVDDHHKLMGVIGMRDFIIALDSMLLKELMIKDVISVSPFDEENKALRTLSGRGFTSLPVVDAQGHLLGVVRATNLLAGAQDAAGQDIQKLFGVSKDERAFSPIGFCLKKRLPWLHINLATAFMAAMVVAMFEDIIAKITVLAIYLPVVAGQGGNAGAQALAVVMRGLVMREIPADQLRKLLIKESLIGLVNGLVIGLVTALIAWAWNGNPYLGLVIGLAMIVNLAVAGLAGAAIPIGMKRLGLDPAQSSSIVLTTVTDVVGFFAFLGLAVLFQDLLI
jgi:magnesium transporter